MLSASSRSVPVLPVERDELDDVAEVVLDEGPAHVVAGEVLWLHEDLDAPRPQRLNGVVTVLDGEGDVVPPSSARGGLAQSRALDEFEDEVAVRQVGPLDR